jgi:protein involved in sex pheromone biosynthesis
MRVVSTLLNVLLCGFSLFSFIFSFTFNYSIFNRIVGKRERKRNKIKGLTPDANLKGGLGLYVLPFKISKQRRAASRQRATVGEIRGFVVEY